VPTIRVVIADDHPLVRAGLRQTLATEPTVEVVGEATDGEETLAVVRQTQPDLLLLDITMPGAPFPMLLRHVTQMAGDMKVIVLTMHAEDQFALRALKEGAAGYVTKEQPAGELLEAVRQVARGGRYLTPSVGLKAAAVLGDRRALLPHERLSAREYEVLCLLGQGKTVHEAGGLLGLSPKTISTHRARLLRKMELSTTTDLIRYVLQYGLFMLAALACEIARAGRPTV
jgi:DNA-binding NarL/FixJ family response regulator